MGLFSRRAARRDARPVNVGVVVMLCGEDARLRAHFEEDVALYEAAGASPISYEAPTVADLTACMETQRPSLVHMLAPVTPQGSLVDASGDELDLREFTRTADELGVNLLIIGSETPMSTWVSTSMASAT